MVLEARLNELEIWLLTLENLVPSQGPLVSAGSVVPVSSPPADRPKQLGKQAGWVMVRKKHSHKQKHLVHHQH